MRAYFAVPGDLGQPTGGYGYDRQVLAHAAGAGLDLIHLALPGGYPAVDEAVLAETARRIGATPERALLLIDGLAYGAMPDRFIRALNRPIVELCHHPLALEPGLSAAEAARFRQSERAAMAQARAVIVTGPSTKRILVADFGVSDDRITVAEPGTAPAARAQGSGRTIPHMLAVGSVIPRKGYDVLIGALARLAELPWTLDIVGSTDYAPETAAEVRASIAAAGLGSRVRLCGALDAAALDAAYDGADLFVIASRYEGYGMVAAEAMARGLPIVSTDGGALADTIDHRAGLKAPASSIQALAEAIQVILASPYKRSIFSDGSWAAGQRLPRWTDTAAIIARVLKECGA